MQESEDVKISGTNEALLQGWQDSGVWRVHPVNKISITQSTVVIQRHKPKHAIHNVYKLSFTEKIICFLCASLGFLSKVILTKAVK